MGVRVQVGRGWGGERGVVRLRLVRQDMDGIFYGFVVDGLCDGFIMVFILVFTYMLGWLSDVSMVLIFSVSRGLYYTSSMLGALAVLCLSRRDIPPIPNFLRLILSST